MTLANLLAIQRLQAFSATPEGVQRLLVAAVRNLADARIAQLSPENRFDAAYKCILQCAMLGLWARGYRTSTSQPGHHQTALQALPLTMGLRCDTQPAQKHQISARTPQKPQGAQKMIHPQHTAHSTQHTA